MQFRRATIILSFGALLFLIAVSLYMIKGAAAAPIRQESPTPLPQASATPSPAGGTAESTPTVNMSISNDICLGCHGTPGQTMTLSNGDVLDLYVPDSVYHNSIHGEMGYACVQCHTTVGDYPHPPFEAANRREVTVKLNESCGRCHAMQSELEKDSVHAIARAAGYQQAAVCVDCHTAHDVRQLNDPNTHELLPDTRSWIPDRCALCHNAIYQEYKDSVHGAALSEGNQDVPTCIDCHGVHNIENPRTAYFRLRSPDICSKCHTDAKIMNKYGISTDVQNTYVSDFHGTTVAIFEKTSPDSRVNKPVCYDCHGVHNISRVDDPQTGLEMRQNLLARCQLCHPDANANFPSAWMSHYIPSPEHYSLVYYVNLFYKFFIPFTLGGMALLVVMDAGRTMINRSRKRPGESAFDEENMPEEKDASTSGKVEALDISEELPAEQPPVEAGSETATPDTSEPSLVDDQPLVEGTNPFEPDPEADKAKETKESQPEDQSGQLGDKSEGDDE
jgi:hypothetical protein